MFHPVIDGLILVITVIGTIVPILYFHYLVQQYRLDFSRMTLLSCTACISGAVAGFILLDLKLSVPDITFGDVVVGMIFLAFVALLHKAFFNWVEGKQQNDPIAAYWKEE